MAALRSVLAELAHVVKHADTRGIEMKGHHRGWRRAAFPSQRLRGRRADLLLVFKPLSDGRVEVRVFGHRRLPDDVYVRSKDRLNGA
jgi:hypothetical protein